MKPGEIALEHDWFWRLIPPVITGAVVFLITKLWDASKYEARFAALESRLVSKAELKSELSDFQAVHIEPLKRNQSKFDSKLEAILVEVTATREIVLKLEARFDSRPARER